MIKVDGEVVVRNHFPDGTQYLHLPDVASASVLTCYENSTRTIEWRYENDEELVTLWMVTKQMRANGARHVQLIMPYIPHARMDRTKHSTEVFTLKYFAEIINSLQFERVVVLDAHSCVATALLDRVEEDNAHMDITMAIQHIDSNKWLYTKTPQPNELMAFFPDEGAMKRYAGLVSLPYAFGIKQRNLETGKIEGLDVAGCTDMIAGRDVIMIDDICSRGGTFYHSAKKLKELGAENISIYVTHCEQTIFDGDLIHSGLIKRIYTTDSIFGEAAQKRAAELNVSYLFEVEKLKY